ncbi:MAG: DNA-binding protein [Clostridia bacterium]|nr:DNA-binding protein [Clostridia bacterium]
MFENYYLTVDEVAQALKISKSFAYKVIRNMNAELKEQGFFTMSGRINKQFFLEKTQYNPNKLKERK